MPHRTRQHRLQYSIQRYRLSHNRRSVHFLPHHLFNPSMAALYWRYRFAIHRSCQRDRQYDRCPTCLGPVPSPGSFRNYHQFCGLCVPSHCHLLQFLAPCNPGDAEDDELQLVNVRFGCHLCRYLLFCLCTENVQGTSD